MLRGQPAMLLARAPALSSKGGDILLDEYAALFGS
jgi:hypothetical protein